MHHETARKIPPLRQHPQMVLMLGLHTVILLSQPFADMMGRGREMILMRNAQGLKCKSENVLLKSKIK